MMYAGEDKGGKLVCYSLRYLGGILDLDETELHNSLIVLRDHSHIDVEEPEEGRYVIQTLVGTSTNRSTRGRESTGR